MNEYFQAATNSPCPLQMECDAIQLLSSPLLIRKC